MTIDFLPFAGVSFCEHTYCLWGSYLEFKEHILMPLIDSFTIWKQPLNTRRGALEM